MPFPPAPTSSLQQPTTKETLTAHLAELGGAVPLLETGVASITRSRLMQIFEFAEAISKGTEDQRQLELITKICAQVYRASELLNKRQKKLSS